MKINKLEIRNFKNYTGINRFDLSVTDQKKIILIGGENGSGKTTIQEAIRLCLFGRLMDGPVMSEKEYNDYISGCLNKSARSKGIASMSIILDLTMDDSFPIFDLKVRRSFHFAKKGMLKEELELTQSDQEIEMVDAEFWEDYIRSLIPPTASKYFFFDGEKVKDVIASVDADDYIREAVESISGLSGLRTLRNDLSVLKKRNIKAQLSSDSKKEIETLESELEGREQSLEKIRMSMSTLEASLQEEKKKKTSLEEEIRRKLGSRDEDIRNLQKTISELEVEERGLKSDLHTFYKDILPFCICRNQLKTLKESIESERSKAIVNEAHHLIRSRIEGNHRSIVADLVKLDIDNHKIIEIIEAIKKNLSAEAFVKEVHAVPYLSEEQIIGIHKKFDEVGDSIKFGVMIKRLEEIQIQLVKMRRQQKRIGKSDVNGDFAKAMDDTRSEIARLEVKIEEKIAEYNSIKEGIQSLNDVISDLEEQQVMEAFHQEKDVLIAALISNLDERIDSIVSDCVGHLQKHINSMYERLMHKEDMVEKVAFSHEGFRIRLVGFDGEEIDRRKLSEGEKSLLALSVQFGLSQISERKLPIIIDSPLGKMDSFHVQKILTEFYPNAGDQVIILSHDREITCDLRDQISGTISSSYLLSLGEADKVTKGYFKEATP